MKTNKEIIEEASQRYGKMWDIKPHALAGKLWWKSAMNDALELRDKEILKIIERAVYSPKLDHKRTEEVWILVEELKQALKQNGQ